MLVYISTLETALERMLSWQIAFHSWGKAIVENKKRALKKSFPLSIIFSF